MRGVIMLLTVVVPVLLTAEDWPNYGGPGGRCAARRIDAPMVDAWIDAARLWQSDVTIPNGMAGDARKPARGGEHVVSGGYGTPIVADGRVYLQYSVPVGAADESVVAEHGERFRAKFLVEADDVIHCFDAATGATLWRTAYEKASLNMQSFTKAGPSLTCCAGAGRIFAHLAGGRIVALDAATGEKLWNEPTPRFERLQGYRAQTLERRRLVGFNRDFATSPVFLAGVVTYNDHYKAKVSPPGDDRDTDHHYDEPSNLVAVDAATGAELWRLAGGCSNTAQPLAWQQGDEELLVAVGDDAVVRCFEPRTGAVRWSQQVGDGGRIVVADGMLVAGGGTGKKDRHLVGYRITGGAVTPAWTLQEHGRPRHLAARDGHLYGYADGRIVCVALATGTVAATAPATNESHFDYFPVIVGSRIVCAGSDSDQIHLYTADPQDLRLLDDAAFPHAWGYTMPLLPACADGRVYVRTHDRLVCYDLRAGDDTRKQALDFALPAGLLDDGEPFDCRLRVRDGALAGGWCRRGESSLSIATDELTWDGSRLHGTIRLKNRYHGVEPFAIDASLADGRLHGSIRAQVTPFAEAIELSGSIRITAHQKWMPACTHVIRLDQATRTRSGAASHLFLFATIADGELTRLSGMADRTIKSWPALRPELTLADGRLTGSLRVLYRPDRWSTVQVEAGTCAAARYQITVDLDQTDDAGSFTGHWGVAWEESGALEGVVRESAAGGQ